MTNDYRGWTNRDTIWAMALVIVSLMQYIITSLTQQLGDNEDVVSYVGFAGTIASILLAVIAIVYSFVQSFSSQRDTHNLSSRLADLSEVTRKITSVGDQVSQTTTRLGSASDQLASNVALIRKISTGVANIETGVADLRTSRFASDMRTPQATGGRHRPGGELYKQVARFASGTQLAVYRLIQLMGQHKVTTRELREKIIAPIISARATRENHADIAPEITRFMHGFTIGHLHLLSDMGCLDASISDLKGLQPEFATSVTESIQKNGRINDSESEFMDVRDVEERFDVLFPPSAPEQPPAGST